jgi:hypothetical protein
MMVSLGLMPILPIFSSLLRVRTKNFNFFSCSPLDEPPSLPKIESRTRFDEKMSLKRYRIIFILIFMLANGAIGDQTTNAQPSGK